MPIKCSSKNSDQGDLKFYQWEKAKKCFCCKRQFLYQPEISYQKRIMSFHINKFSYFEKTKLNSKVLKPDGK